ncbi:MAG TPA: HEPN domain-containing protein [Spirochaetota bacterium]|nr:HEPN domain-containing protein [Spirochaetota bacterium]
MISNADREALIAYRFEQAKETIAVSEFLFNSDKLPVAVNRIYYGIYYALTALALKHMFETSKHAQLLGWFNRVFISGNIVDISYGRILRNAFQNRTKSDYDAYIHFDRTEVAAMLEEMKDFIAMIESLLK